MVALTKVKSLNAKAATTLPSGIVAVFAGATAGIGELALKTFAKHTQAPRIYFIGRSQEAGDRLKKELKATNSQGEYIFIKADMSLLKSVDEVSKTIKAKETAINVLFMSQGTMRIGSNTSEGLPYITALSFYSRTRLAANLLPLIQRATALRRVVSVLAGSKEGQLFLDDIPGANVGMSKARGHSAMTTTLSLEAFAKQAPEVSFVHVFPGAVKTNLIRGDDGAMLQVMKYAFKIYMGVLSKYLPNEEVGEREASYCLAGLYPPRVDREGGEGVKTSDVVVGTDGKVGSGVYTVDWDGSAVTKANELVSKARADGALEKVWANVKHEFKRITGSVSV